MSISANETILRAKELYIKAENQGDRHLMDLAHQMAEEARRNGGTIGADKTLSQSVQVVMQEHYQAYHPQYSVPVPIRTYSQPEVYRNSINSPLAVVQAARPSVVASPSLIRPNVNSNVTAAQKSLDEIGRAQRAYDEYMKAGRPDLAEQAHQYADLQRQNLRNIGVSDSLYNSNVDLRNRYNGSGSAGVYDPNQSGQVVRTTPPVNSQQTTVVPTKTATSVSPVQSAPSTPSVPGRNEAVTLQTPDVQKSLDEIGRAQAAFDQYMKEGRQDLAVQAHQYADSQRDYLKGLGLNEKYYDPSLDLRWRYLNHGPAGQYDPNQKGTVVIQNSTSPAPISNTPLNINDPRVQKALDEIGRSQAAYDQYMKAGRQDLADETHQYADQQRSLLKSWGIDDQYYYSTVDLRSRYKSDAPPGAWDPTQPGHVPLVNVSVPLPVPAPTGIDKALYDLQVQWWDAKINLSDTSKIEAQANALRAKGAKDTDASRLLGDLNSQVYNAVIDKYNAIVNLDATAYNRDMNVIKKAREMGSTLTSDNTGLDQANIRVLNDKQAFWDAKMVGRSTSGIENDAMAARQRGATITTDRTALDDTNASIAAAKANYYNGWANLDQQAQNTALQTIAAQQSRGDFFGRLGLIGDHTTLDTLNQQVIDAKYAWWNARADGNVSGMQQYANQMTTARNSGATIPINTKLDSLNQQVYDRTTDFKQAFHKFDFQTVSQKLMEIRDLQHQGASIGIKKQVDMTQYGLNQVLFQTQSAWWDGQVNEDSSKMALAADTGNYLRSVLGAQDTEQGRNMAIQNKLLLDGKKNYWNAYANLDHDGLKRALGQIGDAIQNGATISGMNNTQIDKDNEKIIQDKVNHWIAKGDNSQAQVYENDANTIRSKAANADAGDYLIQGTMTGLDQTFSNWYDAKKGRWDAEANGADQSSFVDQGHAAYNKLYDFDSQSLGLIINTLRSNTSEPASADNVKLFNIDIQNRAVLNNRDQINQDIASNNLDDARKLLNSTKQLMDKGATLDISQLVKIPDNSVSGDEIVQKAEEVIYGNEGNYATVAKNDGGALSIGRIQWHADRALNLLRKIQAADPNQTQQILSGTSISSELSNSGTDWSNRTLNDNEQTAISKLLDTSVGHQIQDQQMQTDVQGYLNDGRSLGITDPKALIYFADLDNQRPKGAYDSVDAAGGGTGLTLEKLHQAALNDNIMGQYTDRRNATYQALKNWNLTVTGETNGSTEQKRQALIEEGKYWIGKINYKEDPVDSKIVNLRDARPQFQDCSSFVGSLYKTVLGIDLPRTTFDQIHSGHEVSNNDLQKGDLIFFNDDNHVGIFEGNEMVLHCAEGTQYSNDGVKETRLQTLVQYVGPISHVRRIID